MGNVFLRVKGIVKKDDKYLVIKRWMDDRIPDPFVWEFIDGEVSFGEAPDDAMSRLIQETLGVAGNIEHIVYTWSNMLGDTQCVGIAYLCSVDADAEFNLPEDFGGYEWVERDRFDSYIENMYVLKDLEGVEL
ncbi:MAG: NUDIX hydrolase [Clostridiales bacterium]|nr:NUDIX hydrolase [Clostridiales bacterium]